jgi:hypothetical protein
MNKIVPRFSVFLEGEGIQFSRNLGPRIRGQGELVSWTWS